MTGYTYKSFDNQYDGLADEILLKIYKSNLKKRHADF